MKKFVEEYLSNRVLSRFSILILDVIMIVFSCLLTYFLRYGFNGFSTNVRMEGFWITLMLVVFNVIFFMIFRTFSGILRFSAFTDLLKIVYSLTLGYGLSYILLKTFSFRPVIMTDAPILEHSIAIALPIPDEAPVTNMVLFSREKGLYTVIFYFL
jgi:FlaA1/EpsC-like NDP-sugar epimerase